VVILMTGVGGEKAKTVRWSSAAANSGSREKVGLEGNALEGRDLRKRDRITVSGVSGVTPSDFKFVGGYGSPSPPGERGTSTS